MDLAQLDLAFDDDDALKGHLDMDSVHALLSHSHSQLDTIMERLCAVGIDTSELDDIERECEMHLNRMHALMDVLLSKAGPSDANEYEKVTGEISVEINFYVRFTAQSARNRGKMPSTRAASVCVSRTKPRRTA